MADYELPVTLISPRGREEVVDTFERANNLILTCGYKVKREAVAKADNDQKPVDNDQKPADDDKLVAKKVAPKVVDPKADKVVDGK